MELSIYRTGCASECGDDRYIERDLPVIYTVDCKKIQPQNTAIYSNMILPTCVSVCCLLSTITQKLSHVRVMDITQGQIDEILVKFGG